MEAGILLANAAWQSHTIHRVAKSEIRRSNSQPSLHFSPFIFRQPPDPFGMSWQK
jgi:hypothetical protein